MVIAAKINSEEAQIFTIEGLIAAIIMLVSATLVLGTGMTLSSGDLHIADMQLEQMGSDVLAMMDTKNTLDTESTLERIIANTSQNRGESANNIAGEEFKNIYSNYLKRYTGATPYVDSIKFAAFVYAVNTTPSDPIIEIPITKTSDNLARNPAVTVSRFVSVDNFAARYDYSPSNTVVRVEVLLWRD